ncbi:MAG: hypothetical protein JXX29_03305 [Deltaproteobacteria bacterium]|nr:hypothetical protein [Deltaproteobacteria bacterium]MBN2670669.1 hypothetical protein [Deltaproteobacteria bacterium]
MSNFLNACLVAILSAAMFVLGCDGDKSEAGECKGNVDCGLGACVLGECVVEPAECQTLGTFVDGSVHPFSAVDYLEEVHVLVDDEGAAHYCYSGYKDNVLETRYGKQTSFDEFEEINLKVPGEEQVKCGAIALSSEGVPYVLSRSLPAFVYYENGQWYRRQLDSLQEREGKGAVASSQTVIHLSPDTDGGMFVSMSLGFDLGSQPIYIAHILNGTVEELVNGWVEEGTGTVLGYAPQVIGDSVEDARYLAADDNSYNMQWMNLDGTGAVIKEGFYPKLAQGTQGYKAVAYVDRNWFLKVDSLSTGFTDVATVDQIDLSIDLDGQIPWDVAQDVRGRTHLIYENTNQGYGRLSYRRVNATGVVSDVLMVSDALVQGLPGMQRYALNTDVCGRPTVALIEYESEVNDITGESTDYPVLKIREGY